MPAWAAVVSEIVKRAVAYREMLSIPFTPLDAHHANRGRLTLVIVMIPFKSARKKMKSSGQSP